MQNPKITEIESKYNDRIVKAEAFENLVNVVVLSLNDFVKKLENDTNRMYTLFESKNTNKARFILYNSLYKSVIFSTADITIQVPDQK